MIISPALRWIFSCAQRGNDVATELPHVAAITDGPFLKNVTTHRSYSSHKDTAWRQQQTGSESVDSEDSM